MARLGRACHYVLLCKVTRLKSLDTCIDEFERNSELAAQISTIAGQTTASVLDVFRAIQNILQAQMGP